MNRNILILVIIAFVLVLGYAGIQTLSQSSVNTNPSEQKSQTSSPANSAVASPAAEVKTFNVEGKPFSFTPNEIRVKKGDTVKINFTNTEGFHDFVIDEFSAKTKQLQAGQSETIEFVADKTGEFTYYCSVFGHREKGMTGSLIVE